MLLVGLGNPGPKYEKNRHNIGFMAVDAIVHRFGFSKYKARFSGLTSEGLVNGQRLRVLKPQTFMNNNGYSVAQLCHFYKIPAQAVLVFYDELDLAPARLRIKQGGGSGGHNGIKSLDTHIGPNYWRIRLGIGHPGEKSKVTGHVLGDFPREDKNWLEPMLEALSTRLPLLIDGRSSDYVSQVTMDLRSI